MFNNSWILLGVGGFFGAIFRYEISGIFQKSLKPDFFPTGTLAVNFLGAFLLGIVFTLYESNVISQPQLLLVGTGFCGAFTTFSTFALETVQVNEQGSHWLILNISANVLLSLLGVVIGIVVAGILIKNRF